MTRALLLGLKLVVSGALLTFLLGKADLAGAGARLAEAHTGLLAAGLLLLGLNVVLVGLRWWLLLRRLGFHGLRPPGTIAGTFASVFVGQVLPGSVGTELVRGWLAYAHGARPSVAVTSVVADRMLAVVSLVLVSGVGVLLGLNRSIAQEVGVIAGVALLAFGALALAVVVAPPVLGALARTVPLAGRLATLAGMLRSVLFSWEGMAGMALSAVVHLCTITTVILIARSLGVTLDTLGTLVVVPIAIFLAALPISIAGWGVREASLTYGLALYGVPVADGALISLTLGLGLLLATLPGAIALLRIDLGRALSFKPS